MLIHGPRFFCCDVATWQHGSPPFAPPLLLLYRWLKEETEETCIGPINSDLGGVSLSFFTVVRIYGLNLQTWDPAGATFSTVKVWTWAADQPEGNEIPLDE